MVSEPISIQIDGKTWYCNSTDTKNYIESIKDKSQQLTALLNLSSGSNPLVSTDENTFIDISEMSEEDEAANAKAAESNKSDIKGFSEENYEKFLKSGGLDKFNSLNDNSTVEDIEAALDEINKKTESLNQEVDKLSSAKTPEEIESVYSNITNIQAALDDIGVKFTNTQNADNQTKPGFGQRLARGVVTAVLLTNPIGWGVLGAASIMKGRAEAKKTESINTLQDKIEEAKKDIQELKQIADENVSEAIEAVMEDYTKDLADVMDSSGEFNFTSATPSVIGENVKNMNSVLEGLEEYVQVCEKYGIDVSDLMELYNEFKGENGSSFAQQYIDSYAEDLNLSLSGGVVCDTTDLSDMYIDMQILIKEAKTMGLDTTSLEGALQTISEANQNEVNTTAQEYSQSSTGDLLSDVNTNLESAEYVSDLAGNVADSATAYDVSTNAMIDASIDLTKASQQQIDDYANGIDISGTTSLAALDEMYSQINDTYTKLQDAGTMLDTSGIEAKLDEITKTKQEIVDKKQTEFENLLDSAKTANECADVESKINDYISKHSGSGVDMMGLSALAAVASSKKDSLNGEDKTETSNETVRPQTSAKQTETVDTTTVPTYPVAEENPVQDKVNYDIDNLKSNLEAIMASSERLLTRVQASWEHNFAAQNKINLQGEVSGLKDFYNTYSNKFNNEIIPNATAQNNSDLNAIRDMFSVIGDRITTMDNLLS